MKKFINPIIDVVIINLDEILTASIRQTSSSATKAFGNSSLPGDVQIDFEDLLS